MKSTENQQIDVLVGSFEDALDNKTTINTNDYIYNVFKCFIQNKTNITLTMDPNLEKFNDKLRNLIINHLAPWWKFRVSGDVCNLFMLTLFKAFINRYKIVIVFWISNMIIIFIDIDYESKSWEIITLQIELQHLYKASHLDEVL